MAADDSPSQGCVTHHIPFGPLVKRAPIVLNRLVCRELSRSAPLRGSFSLKICEPIEMPCCSQ
jgi:hypothetical protein